MHSTPEIPTVLRAAVREAVTRSMPLCVLSAGRTPSNSVVEKEWPLRGRCRGVWSGRPVRQRRVCCDMPTGTTCWSWVTGAGNGWPVSDGVLDPGHPRPHALRRDAGSTLTRRRSGRQMPGALERPSHRWSVPGMPAQVSAGRGRGTATQWTSRQHFRFRRSVPPTVCWRRPRGCGLPHRCPREELIDGVAESACGGDVDINRGARAGARCESVAGSRLSHPGKVGDQGLWSRESSLRMLERRR